MNNKDYYTLKEFIFGLRNEYIKLNEKLDNLKQYITINDNKISNPNIKLDDKKRLFFEYKLKRNLLQKSLINFFNLEEYYSENISDKYDFETHDFINCSNYKITDKDKLYNEINKILNMDIVNKTSYKNLSLEINSTLIRYYYPKHSKIIEYNRLNDNIKINSPKLIKSEDVMDMFIDTKLDKHCLPEYLKNIINNSNVFNKQLIIHNDIKKNNNLSLNIEENEKQIILKKFKK